MTAGTTYAHITFKPETGRPRIAGTGINVDTIVGVYLGSGYSPEEIVSQFPPLRLAQVFAALTYYFDNQDAMDQLMAEDEREADEWRARQRPWVDELLSRVPNRLKL